MVLWKLFTIALTTWRQISTQKFWGGSSLSNSLIEFLVSRRLSRKAKQLTSGAVHLRRSVKVLQISQLWRALLCFSVTYIFIYILYIYIYILLYFTSLLVVYLYFYMLGLSLLHYVMSTTCACFYVLLCRLLLRTCILSLFPWLSYMYVSTHFCVFICCSYLHVLSIVCLWHSTVFAFGFKLRLIFGLAWDELNSQD